MTPLASTRINQGVAVITLDSPPVNALAAPLRAALHEALRRACDDSACKAIAIVCAGPTFIAGADIAELGKPDVHPTFAELFDVIEQAPKPVIAAMHGTALGGGFELALACHYRIAAAGSRIGLPEVSLGLLPGAGGTQRLPRIVGAMAALEIITSGRQVAAAEALELGLVDAIVDGEDLPAAAEAFALAVIAAGAERPLVRNREDRLAGDRGRPEIFSEFAAANARRFKGLAAPAAIIAAVAAAFDRPFDEGLAREGELFAGLVATSQSAALRHLFFAERQAGHLPHLPADARPLEIGSVGVVGAGTMGTGITINFLDAGIPVTLVETTDQALERGLGIIRSNYEAALRKGRITEDALARRMALITPSLDLAALAEADLIIEAVFESMAVKTGLFAKLDRVARDGAILASNTSFLDLDEIAAATVRPEWVVGLHFFSPANIMRLLEVVQGAATAPVVIATAMKLAKRIRKVAVLSGACDGFIANRLMAPRGFQAEAMMLEGIPIEAMDKVLTDYGFAMGHFQMMDLVGLDVVGRDAAERTVMGDLVAAGRLGLKSGAGYYDYDPQRRPHPAEVTRSLIADVAAAHGVGPCPAANDDEILARLLYPVVNEGARILEEGIAIRASDIDVAAVLGYNWPAYQGGPMFWADQVGLPRIVVALSEMERDHGPAFRPAPLLVELAGSGGSFGRYQGRGT